MPTFNALRDRLRIDVLSESDVTLYTQTDLLNFLTEASIEIASFGGFPVATSSSNILNGSTSITPPTDINVIGPRGGVIFNGFPLEEKEFPVIELHQARSGQTRYYQYDPRVSNNIEIAPPANVSGTAIVKYVQDLSGETYSASDTPWGGVLQSWTDTILYLAAVKAYERSQELDKAQYWRQRLQERTQSLAFYLDDDSVLSVVNSRGEE